MKRIGIIGGMSFESTLHYYEQINRKVNERAGGLVSADLVLRSVNFEEYHDLMEKGDWDEIAHRLSFEALDLVLKNKCDYVAVATNAMYKVAPAIKRRIEWWRQDGGGIYLYSRFVHIGDCVAKKLKEVGAKRILLLGTKFTMTEKFMKKFFYGRHNIQVMGVRNYPEEVDEINRIIFEELRHGIVTPESKEFMMNFVYQFPSDSEFRPDAIVLGCTELNMILEPGDVDIPLIDSTQAHIDKLVDLCLPETGGKGFKKSDKYIWHENPAGKSGATLYDGDIIRVCDIYKQNGSWHMRLYRLGDTHVNLGNDFSSIKEVERAATQVIRDHCIKEADWYSDIKKHLPALDNI